MVSARINEFSETLKTLSDSSKELPDAISTRMSEVSEALSRYRLQLASTGKELPDAMSTRIEEATESVRRYKLQIAHTGREISDAISTRINEVNEAMMSLADLSRKPIYSDE
jgi:vacuolar-type H+-ATPase subunit H